MATLRMAVRRRLAKKQFAIPKQRPGAGSYPIPDRSHAVNALARVSQHGNPVEKAKVRRAVARKYPGMEMKGKK